jgi:hypothetical protein
MTRTPMQRLHKTSQGIRQSEAPCILAEQAEASDSAFGFPHWEPLHTAGAIGQEELDLIEVREAGLTQFPLFIRHHQDLM